MAHLTTRTKIALARVAQVPVVGLRRLLGRQPEVVARRRGIRWELDLREGIDLSIYLLGGFEADIRTAYGRLLRPGDVVVDVGANMGAHTLPMARLVGDSGMVIAFEPTEYAFGKLRRNVALNPEFAARIAIEQVALLANEEAAPPRQLPASWPVDGRGVDARLRSLAKTTAGAASDTLDRYLATQAIDRLRLVKVDVDGYELDVLEGARRTLAELRPLVLFEFAPYVLYRRARTGPDLAGLFSAAEYEVVDLARGHSVDLGRLQNIVPDGASVNLLARPL